ncbi:site-specific integrase [Gluconobacter sp. Dm-74]|uniref:tyrosine-type recombinase/integrase n=1 Tax=Gluconobacter sp. Dm-74 TaxID=2799803 RepID=UPI001B8B4E06|nr:site-specific integrase [Gluconobacter sp. Dm-74]MBS1092651.1 site-specific integrase [Gluconobacter sp. Dm-74]
MNSREGVLRQAVADILLFHWSPHLEDITDETLSEYAKNISSQAGRSKVSTISGALVELKIVRQRVTYLRPRKKPEHWERLGVGEQWLSWCQRWHQTSSLAEKTRRGHFGDLMTAGRWLMREHPEITSPVHWTLDIAFEYVRFVDTMRIGELLKKPRPNLNMGEPLQPNSKISMLSAMRVFFRDLQYWEWIKPSFNPVRGFSVPRQVLRSRQRNPRPIDEAFWLKIRAAALSLRAEDLPRPLERGQWRYTYPLEMVQALAVVWAFSGCRSNEITRLEVGCTYMEHLPGGGSDDSSEQVLPDFDQPMLRIPVNKTRGEFVKPIERPLMDAVKAWEKVRPTQPPLRDSTTGQMVQSLFCFRGRRVSNDVLNSVIIPILLRKAGLPTADSRGAITSHRARSTMATKLYNSSSGLGPVEVMNWLGHTHFSSTQHYLELTPVRLMTAFHKSAKMTENLRMVSVLVDSQASPGDPIFRYDLGHGWCTNPAYSACSHRMACARCDFYDPAENFAQHLAQQSERYVHMLQELNLTKDETDAITGDSEAVDKLLSRIKEKK